MFLKNQMRLPIISIKNLTYFFQKDKLILKDISLSIYRGEFVAIIGPNGCGKTTLVKIISGLLSQKSQVRVRGKLEYIPQKFNQDLHFPAKVCEILNLECCSCALRDEVLKNLDVSNLQHKQFKSLSGGEQQRVFLALCLLSNPEILVLDEPTIGVDTKTQEKFYKLLKKLNIERNLTILLVTHDTGMISKYFTKIICIHNKKAFVEDSKNIEKLLRTAYGDSFYEFYHNH